MNRPRLTLSGRNGSIDREVFIDDESIGFVTRRANGLWAATDLHENNHGDRYIDEWGAAKQLALGLGVTRGYSL